ncbi:hypothetical protein CDL15_Pgr022981 [Punica granatum]|uniref:Uncharacterized protein n=1 Tax=Punica granatum TaxID=22663 RepID=A0A218X4C6_PUNGR|nr:hypothetical protein CDL15_Pgr022981 [Punica granatum]
MGRGGNNCNLLVLAADDAEIGYFAACCKIVVRLLQAVQRFWPRDLHGRRSCVRANPGMRRHLPADNTRAKELGSPLGHLRGDLLGELTFATRLVACCSCWKLVTPLRRLLAWDGPGLATEAVAC